MATAMLQLLLPLLLQPLAAMLLAIPLQDHLLLLQVQLIIVVVAIGLVVGLKAITVADLFGDIAVATIAINTCWATRL